MKVGFILECRPDGPDAGIYPYLAKEIFCPSLEIRKPETLVNKQRLIRESPIVAQTLLADGCDYVFIIWDRMPAWGGSAKCQDHKDELEKGLKDLSAAEKSKIILCCIDQMLESWMIVDGRFITDYFQKFSPARLQKFSDNKDSASQSNPKDRITNYNGRYNDYKDNLKIVKSITDFTMHARWNDSFRFFKESVESICQDK